MSDGIPEFKTDHKKEISREDFMRPVQARSLALHQIRTDKGAIQSILKVIEKTSKPKGGNDEDRKT